MTLDTRIAIHQPVDWADLHNWVNDNLLKPDDWGDKEIKTYPAAHGIDNALGQGLNALFGMKWAPDGESYDWAGKSADAEDREYYGSWPECAGVIDFDTPYGSTINNMNAWTLHAYFIHRLAREYFEPRNITFHWQDESSGDWSEGLTGFEKLFESGDAASSWFHGLVVPLISSGLLPTQSQGLGSPIPDPDPTGEYPDGWHPEVAS